MIPSMEGFIRSLLWLIWGLKADIRSERVISTKERADLGLHSG